MEKHNSGIRNSSRTSIYFTVPLLFLVLLSEWNKSSGTREEGDEEREMELITFLTLTPFTIISWVSYFLLWKALSFVLQSSWVECMLEVLSHPSPSFNLDNSHVHHVSNHHYHLVLTYSEFINDSFVWECIDDGDEVDISIRCVFSTKLSSLEKVNHI